jgi:hypothetical protein
VLPAHGGVGLLARPSAGDRGEQEERRDRQGPAAAAIATFSTKRPWQASHSGFTASK